MHYYPSAQQCIQWWTLPKYHGHCALFHFDLSFHHKNPLLVPDYRLTSYFCCFLYCTYFKSGLSNKIHIFSIFSHLQTEPTKHQKDHLLTGGSKYHLPQNRLYPRGFHPLWWPWYLRLANGLFRETATIQHSIQAYDVFGMKLQVVPLSCQPSLLSGSCCYCVILLTYVLSFIGYCVFTWPSETSNLYCLRLTVHEDMDVVDYLS